MVVAGPVSSSAPHFSNPAEPLSKKRFVSFFVLALTFGVEYLSPGAYRGVMRPYNSYRMKVEVQLTVLILIASLPAYAQQDVAPSEVFQEVKLVERQLLQVLDAYGERPRKAIRVDVEHVSSREVYILARLAATKVSVMVGAAGERSLTIPPNPLDQIKPYHVLKLVTKVHEGLNWIAEDSGFPIDRGGDVGLVEVEPTDVFRRLFVVNRWLNQVMPFDIEPIHVRDQIAGTIAYLDLFQEKWGLRHPDEVDFSPGKRPMDVANQLQTCYKLLERVALAHDFALMHLETTAASTDTRPADVYDWATILRYQVANLYIITSSVTEVPAIPPKSHDNSPSHAFQHARNLEASLNVLIGRHQIN